MASIEPVVPLIHPRTVLQLYIHVRVQLPTAKRVCQLPRERQLALLTVDLERLLINKSMTSWLSI